MVNSDNTASIAAIGECMMEVSGPLGSSTNLTLAYGGDTLNTAVYMSRLGLSVEYVTAIGDDPYSRAMQDLWHDENIGTRLVQVVPGKLPGLYMIETSQDGERSFYYWRENSPARDLFENNTSTSLFTELEKFSYLYLSGITLSLYSDTVLQKLWDFFIYYRKLGGKIIFDSNYRPAGWESPAAARKAFAQILQSCDIALPSFSDEQALHGDTSIEDCIARYQEAGVKEIIVKNAEDGCHIILDNEISYLPVTTKITPVDTTAAGDSFNGGYIASRLNNIEPINAAKVGQRCAEAVILHPGAIAPKEATPTNFLKE